MNENKHAVEVISFCRGLNLNAELVGQWVWVTFAERPERDLLRKLKQMGFRWSKRRGKWANNCGHPAKSAHQSNPWETYSHRFVSGSNVN